MLTFRCATLALLGSLIAASAQAAEPATEIAVVHVARPASASPATSQRLERRIAAAALEACGAPAFSAPGLRDAVAQSACWRQAYADGIAQMGAARGDSAALAPPPSPGKP